MFCKQFFTEMNFLSLITLIVYHWLQLMKNTTGALYKVGYALQFVSIPLHSCYLYLIFVS